MKKRVVCVAPFAAEDIATVLYLTEFLPGYTIGKVVAPNGMGIDGRDIGHLENREPLGYVATLDLALGFDGCDTVLIPARIVGDPQYRYAVETLENAIDQGKDILCLLPLTKREWMRYAEICKVKGIQLSAPIPEMLPRLTPKDMVDPLYRPYAPVVFVGELAQSVQGYEVFCALIRACRQLGMRVSAISEEASTNLFGFHTLDLSALKGDPAIHVHRINRYIRNIEAKEHPDIIAIKLPKPMIKFDDTVKYDFGVTAHIVSQAISASFFIVCSPFGFFAPDFWSSMSQSFEAKFGYAIDAAHMSNKVIDTSDQDKGNVHFLHMPMGEARAALAQTARHLPLQVMNLVDAEEMLAIARQINEGMLNAPYGLIG